MSTFVIRNLRKNRQATEQSSNSTPTTELSMREKFVQKRQKKEQKNRAILNTIIALLLGLVVGLPTMFLASPKIAIGGTIGVIVMFLSFQYPRMALWGFLIYMPFSGTVIYWLAGGSAILQIAKDAFYIPALLALIIDCRRRNQPIFVAKQLMFTLSLLFGVCLATLFLVNGLYQLFPDLNSWSATRSALAEGEPFLQGLLGLKVLMGYIPLIFCAYYLIEDKKTLLRVGRVLVTLAVICCALGIMQYLWLKTGRCQATSEFAEGGDLFKASLDAKCLVGGAALYSPEFRQIRLPGTFVSPWHWAWFLIGNSAICYTVAFFDPFPLWRLIGMSGMALVAFNAIICGQRIAFALVPVFIVAMLIGTGQVFRLKRFLPIAIGLGVALVIFISNNPEFVQERFNSFIARWNTAPPHLFIANQFDWAVRNYPFYNHFGIFGAGLGKATSSTRFFGPVSFVETFHPKLIYEIGYLGFFAFMAFITNLVIFSFKQYRSLKDPELRSFALAFLIFIILIGYFPYWYPLDTDPVSTYFWLFAGIILKLPVIDKQERSKEVDAITTKGKQGRNKLPYRKQMRLKRKSL